MYTKEQHPLYSVYFAPRGYVRMLQMGSQVAQRHLSAFDRLIGIIGESGSGKSLLIKGMFPGLELTNDDNGVNVRPLPLLDVQEEGFYQPHTYHMDVRFESAFTQLPQLAEAVRQAIDHDRRVVVEHFEMIYPLLGINAELLVGIGEELIVARPTIFGPEPEEIAKIVFASNVYRRMTHTAEDLTERYLRSQNITEYSHGDVRHGFVLRFDHLPQLNLREMEARVGEEIARDLPVSFLDEQHIRIGENMHRCTGPRMHLKSTGQIKNFRILPDFQYDPLSASYLLVGLVGEDSGEQNIRDLNKIDL